MVNGQYLMPELNGEAHNPQEISNYLDYTQMIFEH